MNSYKPNTIAPDDSHEIIYGENHEYGMGGPYASSVNLQQKNCAPFFICDGCYGPALWNSSASAFCFLVLNVDRKIQIMLYEIGSKKLTRFASAFGIAEINTFKSDTVQIYFKSWSDEKNSYIDGTIDFNITTELVEKREIVSPKIRIQPTLGIDIISFYDDRETVQKRIKGGTKADGTAIDYYTSYGFHVHYDKVTNLVCFIEIMYDMQAVFDLYDKNPFHAPVEEMVALLTEKNGADINKLQSPRSYIFLDISLGIFRNSTPEQMDDYLEKAKVETPDYFVDGKPQEWLQIDIDKAKHFQTIGLGNKDYFKDPIYLQNI
jgi:hypothetical protein